MYLVIGKQNCPYCDKAKALLDRNREKYIYIDITSGDCVTDSVWRDFLVETLKARTVPQVFKLIPGGYEGLLGEQAE